MKVPPAATYRSRIANEVGSSVLVPNSIAPRLSTLTSRRVFGSVPIVRYFTQIPLQPRSCPGAGTSLDAGARSRSSRYLLRGASVSWPATNTCPWPVALPAFPVMAQSTDDAQDAESLLDRGRLWR